SAVAHATTTVAPPQSSPTSSAPAATAVASLVPTPACGDEPTLPQTAGPFYTPNSPQRASLREPGIAGVPLTVTGLVVSTTCQPVAGALLDFWHCDSAGVYDNTGYRLRGHQFADGQGRLGLETIVPAVYPGHTSHIHGKVQAPNRPAPTTQLYFPDEPANRTDGIFRAALVMAVEDRADGKYGTFTFVLDLA
ncbi:MAG: dioxygenase, partial [Actinobacteria bacterium]|nr:dioxygenase [Actinomycetota bacterium]